MHAEAVSNSGLALNELKKNMIVVFDVDTTGKRRVAINLRILAQPVQTSRRAGVRHGHVHLHTSAAQRRRVCRVVSGPWRL